MLPASNKGPSLNAGFPDVCLTPVGPVIVPIPYPNFGAHATAVTFSPIVMVGMIPALNLASVLALTTGDEPGVAHWTVQGPGAFDMGHPMVFVDMLPAICLTCPTDGNTANNEPGTVVMPGAPNVLYTLASPPAELEESERVSPLDRLGEHPIDRECIDGEHASCRIRIFGKKLPGALHLLCRRWEEQGITAATFDLRGCPGGELTTCIRVASDFLREGALIATIEDPEGDPVEYRAAPGRKWQFELTLLVDEDTASAAEIFAESLAAHGRAAVVGGPMCGKKTAQVYVGDRCATVARIFVERP